MGLRHVFGDKPVPRLLDFMLVHRLWDYPISELARATGVSYRTLQTVLPGLVKNEIIKETRTVANARFYRLNFGNPAVKSLDKFALEADFEMLEKSGQRQQIAAVARTH